jgi:hypothetical protein
MPQREFANQKALVAHAERNDLAYEYEYTPAFAKRERLLSPEQYQIVEVRTSRGVSRVMLFSKAIIQAEWEAWWKTSGPSSSTRSSLNRRPALPRQRRLPVFKLLAPQVLPVELAAGAANSAMSFRGPKTSIGNNVQRADNNSPPRSRRRIGLELGLVRGTAHTFFARFQSPSARGGQHSMSTASSG